jgi:thiamine-phosphate pyrophosphorylase
MFSFSSKLYPITDSQISGLSHADQVSLLSAGGASMIQLREKKLSPREFYVQAEHAVAVAHAAGVRVIINDRVDLAIAAKADGVHLGQDDLPPEAARKLLGPKAIIGFSTHNIEQVRRAACMPIDYIAIGPIFATTSKEKPEPTVGLEGLRQVRDVAGPFPVVAIGGITQTNAAAVISAGAAAIAVIGALLRQPEEISERTGEFLALL